MPPIGLIVNPRSGCDVRRLLAAAVTVTLESKVGTVRRIVLGAREVGADRFLSLPEPHQIVRRATETLAGVHMTGLDVPLGFDEHDTVRAARALRVAACPVVVVLGGDGTNRAVALGWPDAPVLALSTGTNNAFPIHLEPTVAGMVAGLVATGAVTVAEASTASKVIHVEHGDDTDVALIDAAAVADPYVGSLELFDPMTMRLAVLTRAQPAAIGLSSIGGVLAPVGAADDGGLLLVLCPPDDPAATTVVRALTAPGHYDAVGIVEARRLAPGERVEVAGPVLLAFDGERKRRVREGERAALWVARDGPRVIDPARVMALAAERGLRVERRSV